MRAYYTLDRRVLRRFDAVAPVSQSVARVLRRSGVPADRITVIPNGIDIDQFRDAPPTLRGTDGLQRSKIVGFVGRFVPAKGGAVLLQAARKVIERHPDTTFVFVGDGPLRRQWQELAAALGVSAHVVFTGLRGDMPGVYASMDIMTLPSFDEASPICVREAMAAAKPVICTPVGDLPSLVQSGVTGLFMPPGDHHALADSIMSLLTDRELARRLGENGRAHVAAQASAQRMAAGYMELYRSAIRASGHGGPGS
jgi:glycosyltransferase involved in cell wall biosynthesis